MFKRLRLFILITLLVLGLGLSASAMELVDGVEPALTVSGGGTGATSFTDHGVLVGSGTSAITALTVATNGQLLVGYTGADPIFATVTDGEGITTTLGAGTFQIDCEDATATNKGVVELATDAETVTGTDIARATTPANIAAKMAAPGAIGGTTPSTGVFTKVTIAGTSEPALVISQTGITGTDNQVIDIIGGEVLNTEEHWTGIRIKPDDLDPDGVDARIRGIAVNLSGVATTNNPDMDGIRVVMPEGLHAIHVAEGVIRQDFSTGTDAGAEYVAHDVVVDGTNLNAASTIHVFDVSVSGGTPSGDICAIGTHSDVAPICQLIGAFSTPSQTEYAGEKTGGGATWVDGVDGSEIFVVNADEVYLGSTAQFSEIEVIMTTSATRDIVPTFWYNTAADAWTRFYPSDDTHGFQNSGIIHWTLGSISGSWTNDGDPGGANASTGYWIKIIRTVTPDPGTPTPTTMKTGVITEYEWDKNGDLLVRDITMQDALIFEGSTDDGNETTVTATDPGADIAVVLQAKAGSLVVDATACWDLEGTKLSITTGVLNVTETDSVVAAINGIVKSNGSSISAATANTDYKSAKVKNDATAAPGVTNDVDEGYTVGSDWLDVTNDKEYVCLDNTDGAAVWTETTQGAGATAVTSTNVVTDNRLVRGDGGSRGVQETTAIVSDAGEMTNPSQPCFLVTSAAAQNDFAEGSDITVVLDTEITDQGGDFATNIFTAPITGNYPLSLILAINNVDTAATNYQAKIVTSNRTYVRYLQSNAFASDFVHYFAMSVDADMDATDTAHITIYQQVDGTVQSDVDVAYTFFSGFLAN